MYLDKIIRQVGEFGVECFTHTQQQDIQDLCYMVDTMPFWAAQPIRDHETSSYLDVSQVTTKRCYDCTTYSTIIRSSAFGKDILIEYAKGLANYLSFDIREISNDRSLFSAHTDPSRTGLTVLIVEELQTGQWIPVFKEIFIRAGTGKVKISSNFRYV